MIRVLALGWLLYAGGLVQVQQDMPPSDFHCIADAKETMAIFSKAVADDPQDDVRLYSGSQAGAILKTINESPPPTNYKADALFVLLHHSEGEHAMGGGGGSVLIFMISDECVTGSLPKMGMSSWVSVLHESIGDDT